MTSPIASPSLEQTPLNADRYHAIDALRAFAMFLGVVLHASLGFMAHSTPFTPKADLSRWIGFDIATHLIHSFRMQLFFLVAGILTALLMSRRTARAFAVGRLKRIGLPLIVGGVVIVPLTILPFYMPHLDKVSRGDVVRGLWVGPSHLWFLEYLLIFSAVALVLALAWRAIGPGGRTPLAALGRCCASKLGLAFLLPVTVGLTLAQGWWVITTPSTWTPEWGTLAYYGWFFLVGCALQVGGVVGVIARGWAWVLPITLVLVAPALVWAGGWLPWGAIPPGPWSLESWGRLSAAASIHGLFTWGMIIGLFGLFGAVCSGARAWVRWLADASYWVYLVHLPLVYWGQLGLATWNVPGLERGALQAIVKFLFLFSAATAVCLLTYGTVVRRTRLEEVVGGGRRAHGR